MAEPAGVGGSKLPTPWSKRSHDTPAKPPLAPKDGPDSPASRLPTPKRRNVRTGRIRVQVACPTPAAATQLFHECFDAAVVEANVVSLGRGIEVEFALTKSKPLAPVKLSLWTKNGHRDAVCARMVSLGWGLGETVYAFESPNAGGVVVSIVEEDADDF